ncbi:MAG: bifunctional protein-serine/threonine kinase/phosphatase [Methylocella sp.]
MTSEPLTDCLDVRVGLCSEQGRRERNEDYAGFYAGTPDQRARFGVIAAIADGVGGAKGGRVAAELAVRNFIDGYLSQPPTQGVRQAGARSLEAVNRWTHAIGRTDPALQNMGCTFTALILRGRQAHVLHLGDTRLYRLRDNRLTLLTEDHTLSGAGRNHILTRAIGPAAGVQIDYLMEEPRVYDRFLLCTDGVHGVLSNRRLQEELARDAAPDETATQIVSAALAARGGDNATALVVDVLSLPAANLADLRLTAAALPILAPRNVGDRVDGYFLGAMLADGRYNRVFRGIDEISQQEVIIKFPKPSVGEDAVLRQAFLRESWIATRVRSPFVGEGVEVSAQRRSCLYTVMPFYEGETLERRLRRPPAVRLASGLSIAIKLAKAVAALHRAGIIHRDIKPDNVVLLADGGLKLIDLGVARLPHFEDAPMEAAPGTPSYMAPELITGAPGDEKSDQFALGVTIYRMFAGAGPYGEIEPFSHPRFGRPAPLEKLRPDLPAWLDRVLARAFAVRPDDRFADVLELIFELENGADRGRPGPAPREPLYARNPLTFWKVVSAILAALLITSIAVLRRH